MRIIMKMVGVMLFLSTLCVVGFVLWGEWWEAMYSPGACVEWFQSARGWAWAAAIGLLIVDLVMPVPATAVMAALGVVYGVALGSAIGVAGSASSGLLGYGVGRWAGGPVIRRIASVEEIEEFRGFFDRWGGAAVIVSRGLPVLPEAMAILAGLARMRFPRFVTVLLLGTVPIVVLFTFVGAASADAPLWGLAAAALIPLFLWGLFGMRKSRLRRSAS